MSPLSVGVVPMDFSFLARGLVVGFSIAAPVGPIGLLCIKRTLSEGRLHGLASGLGAATADAVYGCIAGFGLAYVSEFLVNQQLWLRILGGIFLCSLGLKVFFSKPKEQVGAMKRSHVAKAYISTFFLTITNPMTILSFVGVFAGLGIGSTNGDFSSAAILVLGVFFGSALWWFVLSASVGLLRSRFDSSRMVWVNRISGVLLTAFGLIAVIGLFVRF